MFVLYSWVELCLSFDCVWYSNVSDNKLLIDHSLIEYIYGENYWPWVTVSYEFREIYRTRCDCHIRTALAILNFVNPESVTIFITLLSSGWATGRLFFFFFLDRIPLQKRNQLYITGVAQRTISPSNFYHFCTNLWISLLTLEVPRDYLRFRLPFKWRHLVKKLTKVMDSQKHFDGNNVRSNFVIITVPAGGLGHPWAPLWPKLGAVLC